MTRNTLLDLPASSTPIPDSELAIAVAANEPVHDVTRGDQIWLLLVALIPFAAATAWFVFNN